LRPSPAARAFLLLTSANSLYAFTSTAVMGPYDVSWLSALYCVEHPIMAAALIHFALVFPVLRQFVVRRRRLLLAPYGVAFVLILGLLASYHGPLDKPSAVFTTCPAGAAHNVGVAYSSVAMVLFMALPLYAYWENRLPRVRPQLKAVIPGVVLAGMTALYGQS